MIFISYKSEEEQLMLSVRKQLMDCGYKCWSANPDILGGGNYLEVIPEAMETANAFLLLLSEKSQQSKWVLKEVSQACTYDKPLFALNIDGCIPNKSIAFAYQINQIISGKDRMKDAVQDLIRALYANGILPQSGDSAVQKIEIKAKEASKKPEPEKGKTFYDILEDKFKDIPLPPRNEENIQPTIHSLPPVEDENGKPVNVDRSWVVVNAGNSEIHDYYKVAEIGEIDGYYLDVDYPDLSIKTYRPCSAYAPVQNFSIYAWTSNAFEMANSDLKNVNHSYKYLNRSQRLLASTINGMRTYFVFSESKERLGRRHKQSASLFIKTNIKHLCIEIKVLNTGTSPDCFDKIDEIYSFFYTVAESIKMEI